MTYIMWSCGSEARFCTCWNLLSVPGVPISALKTGTWRILHSCVTSWPINICEICVWWCIHFRWEESRIRSWVLAKCRHIWDRDVLVGKMSVWQCCLKHSISHSKGWCQLTSSRTLQLTLLFQDPWYLGVNINISFLSDYIERHPSHTQFVGHTHRCWYWVAGRAGWQTRFWLSSPHYLFYTGRYP